MMDLLTISSFKDDNQNAMLDDAIVWKRQKENLHNRNIWIQPRI